MDGGFRSSFSGPFWETISAIPLSFFSFRRESICVLRSATWGTRCKEKCEHFHRLCDMNGFVGGKGSKAISKFAWQLSHGVIRKSICSSELWWTQSHSSSVFTFIGLHKNRQGRGRCSLPDPRRIFESNWNHYFHPELLSPSNCNVDNRSILTSASTASSLSSAIFYYFSGKGPGRFDWVLKAVVGWISCVVHSTLCCWSSHRIWKPNVWFTNRIEKSFC